MSQPENLCKRLDHFFHFGQVRLDARQPHVVHHRRPALGGHQCREPRPRVGLRHGSYLAPRPGLPLLQQRGSRPLRSPARRLDLAAVG